MDFLGLIYSIIFFGLIFLIGIYLPGKIFGKKKKKNAFFEEKQNNNSIKEKEVE